MKLPWQREAVKVSSPERRAPPNLPPQGTPVELVLAGGQRLHARVTRSASGELAVLLLLRVSLSPQRLEGVLVEAITKSGVVRFGGKAILEGGDLVRLPQPEIVEALQRREHVRVRTARPVLIRSGGSSMPIECTSIDVSGGGMLISGASHLKTGERVDFRLVTTGDGPPITGSGVVVREEAAGRRAILFDQISEGNQRRLIRFLFDCQREERRRGLELGNGR